MERRTCGHRIKTREFLPWTMETSKVEVPGSAKNRRDRRMTPPVYVSKDTNRSAIPNFYFVVAWAEGATIACQLMMAFQSMR